MGGINSAINYKGHSFHIQTQDQGLKSKYIESLIYKSGKLLSSRKTSYTSLLDSPDFKEEINKLMKSQHQAVINEISEGKLDHQLGLAEKPTSIHQKPITSGPGAPKSEPEGLDKLEIKLVHFSYPSSSTPLSISLEGKSGRPPIPVSFLNITVQAITEFGKEYPLFKGLTDESGKLVLGLDLPQFSTQRFILSVKGEKEGLEPDELEIFLKKD